jgi:hypothetical protein
MIEEKGLYWYATPSYLSSVAYNNLVYDLNANASCNLGLSEGDVFEIGNENVSVILNDVVEEKVKPRKKRGSRIGCGEKENVFCRNHWGAVVLVGGEGRLVEEIVRVAVAV